MTFKQREKGQSLTELAVSFMLIMLILAGAVDFGRAYFALVALRDAAQEGVIYASINPRDGTGITSRVQSSSTTPIDMMTTTVSVECGPTSSILADCSNACAAFSTIADNDGQGPSEEVISNNVTVTVSYDFDFTMPLITAIINSPTIPLQAEQTHTILSPDC